MLVRLGSGGSALNTTRSGGPSGRGQFRRLRGQAQVLQYRAHPLQPKSPPANQTPPPAIPPSVWHIRTSNDFIHFVEEVEREYPKALPAEIATEIRQLWFSDHRV